MLDYEVRAWQQGKHRVAGVDEAGRGPLAGPVVAAAVIFPPNLFQDPYLLQINDSKKLTPKKREKLYFLLMQDNRLQKAIAVVGVKIIDQVNILNATFMAMQEALLKIKRAPDHVMIDGAPLPEKYFPYKNEKVSQENIVKGDSKSLSIAAASILAKVHRDQLMLDYAKEFPQYDFDLHKGYGTQVHLDKLRQHGPCLIHRKSFSPVRQMTISFPSP